MARWNWLRIGGAAQFFAEPTTADELRDIVRRSHAESLPVRILGSGSNILVPDKGVDGVVIMLSAPAFCGIEVRDNELIGGGGARLNHLIATAAREGLTGLEPLVGIPGTLGGALRTNAMGHGGSIGQWTESVYAMSKAGESVDLARGDLRFGRRESNLDDLIVLSARLILERGDPTKVTRQMQKLWIMKRSTQPIGDSGSCSIFADPRGLTAAEIIEQAGLKGLHVGGVAVSDRNANFFETKSGATSADVLALIDQIRQQVAAKLGVNLDPDIELW
jgi:UDP-N-acetylmuramate dehydrogenase